MNRGTSTTYWSNKSMIVEKLAFGLAFLLHHKSNFARFDVQELVRRKLFSFWVIILDWMKNPSFYYKHSREVTKKKRKKKKKAFLQPWRTEGITWFVIVVFEQVKEISSQNRFHWPKWADNFCPPSMIWDYFIS